MSRMSLATPCPAPHASSGLPLPVFGRRLSTASVASAQDDTAEIEYTRALQVDLTSVKPRRRSTFQKREKREAPVTIFEDVIEDQELVVESRREIGGSTLLGKPAQRVGGVAIRRRHDIRTEAQQPGQGRRTSHAVQPAIGEGESTVQFNEQTTVHFDLEPQQLKLKGGLKKEPRRRTIFVPDDTTMLTIHPGANTTDRLNDTFQLPNITAQPLEAHHEVNIEQPMDSRQPLKKSRMSLAVAPRRVPLQHVAVRDSNGLSHDIAGQNGGKENFPPRGQADIENKKQYTGMQSPVAKVAPFRSQVLQPTAASQARQTVVSRNFVPFSRTMTTSLTNQSNQSQAEGYRRPRESLRPSPPRHVETALDNSTKPKRASLMVRPRPIERRFEAQGSRLQQYPVLTEDVAQPELYEDSWLSHQEVALTELINHIFSKADTKTNIWSGTTPSLRESILDTYHQSGVSTLHKRLQASLLYGALSRPRDTEPPPNPAQDIGLRKRFLGFWLDSYDSKSLRIAAQAVFGRQLPRKSFTSIGNGAADGSIDPYKNRRALIGFLETFLIEVHDVEDPDESRGDDPHARWRKMVLRSLMLIWLLDEAKSSQIIKGCLFKPTSPRKSSVAMLHALAGMLVPSIGDITRVLRHLEFDVHHVQDPLDEVTYRIENLAVDFRDGVFLTRLVEVLLFSPTRMRTADRTCDATVTIQMPDMTILESALNGTEGDRFPRTLSQHLKMPCLGRAQKSYNVQVAMSSLHDHGRLVDDAPEVTADDIVDGHRERTLSLLWSLVSNHGLDYLVDFKELTADIKRTAGVAVDVQSLFEGCNYFSQLQQESLLKKWASAYAARQGLRISNITTSFADGKVYAAIVDAFAEYVGADRGYHPDSSPNHDCLERQLRAFGCSNAFVKQLSSTCGTIPSRKTTISNLAFLASRLLPLARQHNAAIVIQRAVRAKRLRMIMSQRIALMRLAHACATVVQTQTRLVEAATSLQRAWREVLGARIDRLNTDVGAFQAIAKAWVVKRKLRREQTRFGSESHSLRVMGGWESIDWINL